MRIGQQRQVTRGSGGRDTGLLADEVRTHAIG
jgi:hypothetical protein